MAQGEGFKHITVTAADDDDVVIRVGAAPKEEPAPSTTDDRADAAAPAGAAAPAEYDTPGAADNPAEGHTPAGADNPAEGDTPVGARSARPSTAATNRPRKAPAKKKRDDYRESTLEDLQSQPMPLAQKVTIIAAVVCIIGAIIYCIAFLG
ncbi:MAG: hypothetical protein E7Z99_04705 [Coriobacteriaceae bacterium]|nr:hypothetical protein [Coriobacteriaceae bacterium]